MSIDTWNQLKENNKTNVFTTVILIGYKKLSFNISYKIFNL